MNPACELCQGACCEAMILPIQFKDEDVQRWFELHGFPVKYGTLLDCKCTKLRGGKCSIYETRPKVCSSFPVGGEGCLMAVSLRRPHKAEQIRRLIENTNSDTSSEVR